MSSKNNFTDHLQASLTIFDNKQIAFKVLQQRRENLISKYSPLADRFKSVFNRQLLVQVPQIAVQSRLVQKYKKLNGKKRKAQNPKCISGSPPNSSSEFVELDLDGLNEVSKETPIDSIINASSEFSQESKDSWLDDILRHISCSEPLEKMVPDEDLVKFCESFETRTVYPNDTLVQPESLSLCQYPSRGTYNKNVAASLVQYTDKEIPVQRDIPANQCSPKANLSSTCDNIMYDNKISEISSFSMHTLNPSISGKDCNMLSLCHSVTPISSENKRPVESSRLWKPTQGAFFHMEEILDFEPDGIVHSQDNFRSDTLDGSQPIDSNPQPTEAIQFKCDTISDETTNNEDLSDVSFENSSSDVNQNVVLKEVSARDEGNANLDVLDLLSSAKESYYLEDEFRGEINYKEMESQGNEPGQTKISSPRTSENLSKKRSKKDRVDEAKFERILDSEMPLSTRNSLPIEAKNSEYDLKIKLKRELEAKPHPYETFLTFINLDTNNSSVMKKDQQFIGILKRTISEMIVDPNFYFDELCSLLILQMLKKYEIHDSTTWTKIVKTADGFIALNKETHSKKCENLKTFFLSVYSDIERNHILFTLTDAAAISKIIRSTDFIDLPRENAKTKGFKQWDIKTGSKRLSPYSPNSFTETNNFHTIASPQSQSQSPSRIFPMYPGVHFPLQSGSRLPLPTETSITAIKTRSYSENLRLIHETDRVPRRPYRRPESYKIILERTYTVSIPHEEHFSEKLVDPRMIFYHVTPKCSRIFKRSLVSRENEGSNKLLNCGTSNNGKEILEKKTFSKQIFIGNVASKKLYLGRMSKEKPLDTYEVSQKTIHSRLSYPDPSNQTHQPISISKCSSSLQNNQSTLSKTKNLSSLDYELLNTKVSPEIMHREIASSKIIIRRSINSKN